MTARILPNNEIIVKQYDDEEIKSLSNALGIADETVANYIARQRQDEGIFIVAWKDELPVGSLFLKWKALLPDGYATKIQGKFSDIENFFVIEAQRAKGIGSLMIQKAEEETRKRGFEILGLAVDTERNSRAYALYLRHGFSDIGMPPFDTSGAWIDNNGNVHHFEEWCIYMTKKLVSNK